jgi:TRAP-type C4-dicarboxylate transport system substrate-binding protein
MSNTLRKALALGAALACCGAASAQNVELKLASFPPPAGALNSNVLAPWAKQVSDQAKGVQVRLYAGGTLGRDPVQQLKLVRDRVVDMAYIVMAYTPGDFPDTTIFDLPFVIENSLEGSLAHWRMYERGLLRGYDDFKVLGLFTLPPASLHLATPMKSLADLKGRQIRTVGPYQSATVSLLGGSPVGGISSPEVSEALSRRVVQGVVFEWNAMISFRTETVSKHHFELPLGTVAAGILMNKAAYAALPPDARAAIDKESGEALSHLHGVQFDKRQRENLDKVNAQGGHTFSSLAGNEREEVRRRVSPVNEQWVKDNPDGRKRYDALAAILKEVRAGNRK